jgi:hypothetical protein
MSTVPKVTEATSNAIKELICTPPLTFSV